MIVDTMVLAYALLGVSSHRKESLDCLRKVDRILVPDSVRAELLHVSYKWVLSGDVVPTGVAQAYEDAEAVYTEVIPVSCLWREALALAFERNHSPYDTLFVAAARQNGCKVLTYDKLLTRLFPEDTITPRSFLRRH